MKKRVKRNLRRRAKKKTAKKTAAKTQDLQTSNTINRCRKTKFSKKMSNKLTILLKFIPNKMKQTISILKILMRTNKKIKMMNSKKTKTKKNKMRTKTRHTKTNTMTITVDKMTEITKPIAREDTIRDLLI